VALQRTGSGRWRVLKPFYRRASCGLLNSYKLERPVFGGRTNRALRISFRVSRAARVGVVVLRGKRVVKRFRTKRRAGAQTHRLRVSAEGLRRGNYRVRLTARRGSAKPVRATLTGRRL
jgi:hypothetical protein